MIRYLDKKSEKIIWYLIIRRSHTQIIRLYRSVLLEKSLRFAVPDESLSEKMRPSTLGVSCPRTRNAFQLLKSFKRRLRVGALTRREAAVRIFSLRREVTSRGDNFQERRLRPFRFYLFGPGEEFPSTKPTRECLAHVKKSISSGEQCRECRPESDTNVSARASARACYTKIGTTRWRHKRKKHEKLPRLSLAGFCFSP